MTQYYNFEWRDNQSAPYEFSPVIDGEVYFCEVGYSSGAGAFVLTVKSSFQEVVCIQNLVSSCDCGDIPLAPQLGFTDNFVFRGSSRCFEVGGVFRECPDFEQPITPTYYPPAYAIAPDTSTINETDANDVTFTVTTANVPDGTTLYYTALDITTEGAADLTPINGSVVITGNTGSFVISAITDALTEGSEGFQCQLRTGSISGAVVATSILITILDTSITVSYAITPATSSVNEGSSLAVTVNTVGIPDGTTLYWTVLNGTTANADFTAVSGGVVIASNTGSFNIAVAADLLTEGSENFTVQLRTGSVAGAVVATSTTVTINDTSTSYPPDPNGNYLIFRTTGDNLPYDTANPPAITAARFLAVGLSSVGLWTTGKRWIVGGSTATPVTSDVIFVINYTTLPNGSPFNPRTGDQIYSALASSSGRILKYCGTSVNDTDTAWIESRVPITTYTGTITVGSYKVWSLDANPTRPT